MYYVCYSQCVKSRKCIGYSERIALYSWKLKVPQKVIFWMTAWHSLLAQLWFLLGPLTRWRYQPPIQILCRDPTTRSSTHHQASSHGSLESSSLRVPPGRSLQSLHLKSTSSSISCLSGLNACHPMIPMHPYPADQVNNGTAVHVFLQRYAKSPVLQITILHKTSLPQPICRF